MGWAWPVGRRVPGKSCRPGRWTTNAVSALVMFGLGSAGRMVARAETLNLTGYQLTFDETFKSLDISARGTGTRWIAHTPWNGDFGDAIFADPGPNGPFSLAPDGLQITARKGADGKWSSGLICSMDRDGPGQQGFAQKFGYFEIKTKLPDGPGVWPAFWLIGTDKSHFSAEIDVFEYYGQFPTIFHSVTHIWKAKPEGEDHRVAVPSGLLTSDYNLFGVDIAPDRTTFYLNRNAYWSIPTPPEFKQPFYILANFALGSGWPIDRLQSPVTMDIAYIKAYQVADRQ